MGPMYPRIVGNSYNSTSGPRRENERGVKEVNFIAVVGATMSKRFLDTGVM